VARSALCPGYLPRLGRSPSFGDLHPKLEHSASHQRHHWHSYITVVSLKSDTIWTGYTRSAPMPCAGTACVSYSGGLRSRTLRTAWPITGKGKRRRRLHSTRFTTRLIASRAGPVHCKKKDAAAPQRSSAPCPMVQAWWMYNARVD
jgi:hypothetical protein